MLKCHRRNPQVNVKGPAMPKDKPTAYDETKKLIEQTGKTGLLSPLMNVLNTLVDDPVLKKTLEEAPPPGQQKKSN